MCYIHKAGLLDRLCEVHVGDCRDDAVVPGVGPVTDVVGESSADVVVDASAWRLAADVPFHADIRLK